MSQYGIKVSPDWDNENDKSFEWMVENSLFIFSHRNSGRIRMYLVINQKLEDEYDCLEIGNDRYGIKVTGWTAFSASFHGVDIIDSSKDVIKFVKDFMIKDGATDLVTEKPTL